MIVTMRSSRTLVVLRHATASALDGGSDEDRPLTRLGAVDAGALGRWLPTVVGTPDLVLCSAAVRTRQTWEEVAAGLGAGVPVRYDARAYLASAAGWATLVREVEDAVRCLVLVGHAPGVRDLVVALLGEPAALTTTPLSDGFPTAAAVVLDVPGPWRAHCEAPSTLRAATVAGR